MEVHLVQQLTKRLLESALKGEITDHLGYDEHDPAGRGTGNAGHLTRIRFLIRDRDAKYPALINEILGTAGIETVLTGVRMPRMNSIMERWVKTLRVELAGPHADVEPGPPAACAARVRAALHRAPHPPITCSRNTLASAATAS